jgi:hypothetical protein
MLDQRHERSNPLGPSKWSKLRHYIGRLGSWSRASKTLLRAASVYPRLLTGFSVQCLSSPPPLAAPIPDEKTNLDSALGRMYSKQERLHLEEAREIVRDTTFLDISAEFLNKYTDPNFKLRIHAELLLLEHFHHRNLEFVSNDRYIGCSKPSCYCCDLYMKVHPGNFVPRPCHGNLWVNWRAPIPPINDEEAAQKHTARMLNDMVKFVRGDALKQLLSRQPRRPKVPDSTTGMSTSFRESRTGFMTTPNLVSNNGTSYTSLNSTH